MSQDYILESPKPQHVINYNSTTSKPSSSYARRVELQYPNSIHYTPMKLNHWQ